MKRLLKIVLVLAIALVCIAPARAQSDQTIRHYELSINDTLANITGKSVRAIAVNGSIPAPTLEFNEGDSAIIAVTNRMDVPTSVHWHGILLPNFEDGVPFLTTPPIMPGKTFTYHFRLRQAGTYWYHSHTMLQEQSGLYGSIIIHPKKSRFKVDGEQILLLSDWTNERPKEVLRTLRRDDVAGEWYSIKKKYPQSLDQLLAHHAWGERLKYAWQRMPPMDIADVYYDRFLVNGKGEQQYSQYKPGQQIRLRVINGSASSYFYIQMAGMKMTLISADGLPVEPVQVDRLLMGVAETYDFLITIPEDAAHEFRATAMDITGYSSAFFGAGARIVAPTMPRANVWKMSKTMMAQAVNFPGRMKMDGMDMNGMDMSEMDMDGKSMKMGERDMNSMDHGKMNHDSMPMMDHSKMDHGKKNQDSMPMIDQNKMDHGKMNHDSMPMRDHSKMAHGMKGMLAGTDSGMIMFNYDMLRATHPTVFDSTRSKRNIHFQLTGNMYRYVWSLNHKTLSQHDSILIHKGETVRFIMENTTMMNHPMHLHGHFFRVLNKNGDYSPLKHTVDVPPMTTVTIEFEAEETGDWFFHCHILYHMMSGMARFVHYAEAGRAPEMENFPIKKLVNEERKYLRSGNLALKSNMSELELNVQNVRNAFRLEADANYRGQYEANLSYERYLNDWLRPYIGFSTVRQRYYNIVTNKQSFEQEFDLPVVGIRYTLPFFIESHLRVNAKGRVRLGLSSEHWLLPRVFFNWSVNTDKEYHLDLQYVLAKRFSFSGGYDSRYRWGIGVLGRF